MNVASAQIDHFKLKPGLYLQEIRTIGKESLFVYDLRMLEPDLVNEYGYEAMSQAVMHSIEHLFAYNLREVAQKMNYGCESIVSVYPFGCATGFGVISTLDPEKFPEVLRQAIEVCLRANEVPFAKPQLCGNYTMQNLKGAQTRLVLYREILSGQLMKVKQAPRIGHCDNNEIPWKQEC